MLKFITLLLLCLAANAQIFPRVTVNAGVPSGTPLPSTCTIGSVFFLTTATAGQNLYDCTSTNVWTVNSTQGVVVSGASLPGTCTTGSVYFLTTATAGQNLYDCTATNTWTQQVVPSVSSSAYGPLAFSSATPQTITAATHGFISQVLNVLCIESGTNKVASVPASVAPGTFSVTIAPQVSFTGNCWISGTGMTPVPGTNGWVDNSTTVSTIRNATVAGTLSSGALSATSTDFSTAGHTLPTVKGTIAGKPGTCTVGELYFATDATAGQNIYECAATNTWTQQLSGGAGVGAVIGSANLTVVGAVPYVSAAGTLQQDQTSSHQFFWDSTNHRLGIGTTTPISPIDISAFDATVWLRSTNTNTYSGLALADGNGILLATVQYGMSAATFYANQLALATIKPISPIVFYTSPSGSVIERMRVTPAGTISIGADVAPTGTLYVHDATPTTGTTRVTIQAGAGDASTDAIIHGVLNDGTEMWSITRSGDFKAVSLRTVPGTFASLAACVAGLEGRLSAVNDSTTSTYAATISGGGVNHVLGYCNGTNWTVH